MCWVLVYIYISVMKINVDLINVLAMPAKATLAILTGFP